MSRQKTGSITEAPEIRMKVLPEDKKSLAWLEHHLMKEWKIDDCTKLENSKIMRYCMKEMYERLRRGKGEH